MKRLLTYFGWMICLFPAGLFAQDLSGLWMGTLSQKEGGLVVDYKIRFDIAQTGKKVAGTSYVSIPDRPELFAEMAFTGKIDNNKLSFRESGVVRQEIIMQWEWCLKDGTLKLDTLNENIWVLEGPWKGGAATPDCPPGRIRLEKELPLREVPVVVDTVETLVRQDTVATTVVEEVPDTLPETVAARDTLNAVSEPAEPNVQGRKIVTDSKADVPFKKVKILIWDADEVDGDKISLYFNGRFILENYKLKKKKKEIFLELQPGQENTLALYALNEGKIPPNTAAVLFWDGAKYKSMRLQSDMEYCGAIQFNLID